MSYSPLLNVIWTPAAWPSAGPPRSTGGHRVLPGAGTADGRGLEDDRADQRGHRQPPRPGPHRCRRHGLPGHRGPAGPRRRGPGPRPAGDAGVLPGPGRPGRRPRPGRLAAHRRPRHAGHRRFPDHRGPEEGADHHLGRKEHLARPDRVTATTAPTDRPGLRDRRPAQLRNRAASPRRPGSTGWAQQHRVPTRDLAGLAAHPQVLAEVAAGVRRANQDLARAEQVRRFTLLPAEWTAETGELTPTLKRRRRVVAEGHAAGIERPYGPPGPGVIDVTPERG